jgi:VWFA-related protein
MARKIACLGIAAMLWYSQQSTAWIAAWQAGTKAAAPGQTYKVKAELVEVRAVVTDRNGRFIENLKREDFELLENNRLQEISFFSVTRVVEGEDQPATGGAAAPDKAAGISSVRARLAEPPARTVVLFIDTLHLSIASLMQVKQALRRFMDERLTERDMIALVTSSGTLGIAEQFTRDRQLLRYAVERLSPGPPDHASFFTPYLASCVERGDAEAMNLAIALLRLEDGISGDRRTMEMMARARASQVLSVASYFRKAALLTLKAVAEQMIGLPGQRMIALFSDGFTLQESGGSTQTWEVQSVISRAVRSGVAIYSIDAKGLQPPPLFNAAMRGGAAGPRLESYLWASEKEEQDGLNALAADTGGKMYLNTNDLAGSLARALDANRSYYLLAYYLASDSDYRQFRRITIRVKNHPEYTVRTAKGFLPSDIAKAADDNKEKTPRQRLLQAVQAPLPRTDLRVSASADFLETEADEAQVSLAVYLEGDNLQYREENQRHGFTLEILSEIYDSSGKRMESLFHNVQGSLTGERLVLARRNGYRFSWRLTLKPGVYQARVGVLEAGTDRIGTATAWVEVPNLDRSKLALSSLVFQDAPAKAGTTAADSTSDALGRSRVVQGVRFFQRDELCLYVFRIHLAAKAPAASELLVQMELVQGSKLLVQDTWQPLSAGKTIHDSKGILVGGQANLAGLKPGLYELRLTVRDSQSKLAAKSSAVFGIE